MTTAARAGCVLPGAALLQLVGHLSRSVNAPSTGATRESTRLRRIRVQVQAAMPGGIYFARRLRLHFIALIDEVQNFLCCLLALPKSAQRNH